MTDQSDDEFDHDDLVERKVGILAWLLVVNLFWSIRKLYCQWYL